MAVDAAPKPDLTLTLALDDDLAAAPARGVERAVDDASLGEAADLLVLAPSALRGRDVDVWLLRTGGRALSALVAERAPGGIAVTALAPAHAEPLLRAVLGHYALEGVERAMIAPSPTAERLGFG